jgi:hypothetical protein
LSIDRRARDILRRAKEVKCKSFAIVNLVRRVLIKQVQGDRLHSEEIGLQLVMMHRRDTSDLVATDFSVMIHYLETLLGLEGYAIVEGLQKEGNQRVNQRL